jgi:hypothetical protein
LAQACLWGYHGTAKLTWSMSSQAVWAPATGVPGGPPRFSVNVKWRFSAPDGDVEGSKLCLFSVIMPPKCVSSVSPRFHYRRVAFCFLPLAAILEFLEVIFKQLFVPLRFPFCRSQTSRLLFGSHFPSARRILLLLATGTPSARLVLLLNNFFY